MLDLSWILSRLDIVQIIDILIVALIFYLIFLSIQGTRAVQLLWGIGVLIIALASVSTFLRLTTLNWLIKNSIPALLVAVPVIFQPELRRMLERLGRASGLVNLSLGLENDQTERVSIEELSRACGRLAERKHGALIVLERNTGLRDYVDTGVRMDAVVTAEALATIFFPNTPLHDGAVIVRGNRIMAAGCILPLAESLSDYPELGTRHRAAVGITMESDALALVVSEQTGTISLAQNGHLQRPYDEVHLKNALMGVLYPTHDRSGTLWKRVIAPSLSRETQNSTHAVDEPASSRR